VQNIQKQLLVLMETLLQRTLQGSFPKTFRKMTSSAQVDGKYPSAQFMGLNISMNTTT